MRKVENMNNSSDEIVRIAGEVFQKYGYQRVSMQDISQASGKGRSTIYNHFKNKDEILDAFLAQQARKILDECKKSISPEIPLALNIENFQKVKLSQIKQLVSKYHLVMEDLKHTPATLILKTRPLDKEQVAILSDVIAWAVDKKEISYLPKEDIQFIAEIISLAFKSLEQDIFLFGKFPNIESKLTWLSQILYKGLS